ncbi:MAG: hypothetical protein NC541_14670 [bacterium]|nr:hypothetical protein [bacterium]
MASDDLELDDVIDNWSPLMLEYPFVRKGMTLREYFQEKDYYNQHRQEVKDGTYLPLWKQNKYL